LSRRPSRREPGAASRSVAAQAVARVLARGETLEAAFAALEVERIAGPDRAQAKALAFGALRWHHRHLGLLGLLLDRPLADRDRRLEALLSVGIYQLLDARQPDYAAVSATVGAARELGLARAAGLVNAALRRLQREREALLARLADDDVARYSHPQWLISRLRRDWPEAWRHLLDASLQPPPLWLRINALAQPPAAYEAQLREQGLECGTLQGVPTALRLEQALPVADIPGFAAGAVTVQDAASQLAAPLLGPARGLRVLDACAAPGGKATHLLEQAGGELELLAIDIDAARLARVEENLARLRLRATTRVADAAAPEQWWDGRRFDRILIDAPCSGTGVIRRHPDIKHLRRDSDIAPLADRQLLLLERLWPLLAPGGRLLYVTCSVLREENDGVVSRFLAARDDACLCAAPVPDWLRPLPGGGWQALPGAADTDGLYYALMTRRQA